MSTVPMTGLALRRALCEAEGVALSFVREIGRGRNRSLSGGLMSNVALKSNSYVTRFGGKIRIASALVALLLGPGLSGCILGSEKPELGLEVPATYREGGHSKPDAAIPALDWWRGFRSSELTKLMESAQINNLDIAVAIAQLIQADALVGVSGAPLLPSVTGTATFENEHFGSASAQNSNFSGLGSSGGSSP